MTSASTTNASVRRCRSTTRVPPISLVPASRPGRACSRTRCSSPRSTTTTSTSARRASRSTKGLPLYVVARLEQRYDLSTMCVAILGMSFKAESDDVRSSLSYKLKRILKFKSRDVLTHDPYVTSDPELVDLDRCAARRRPGPDRHAARAVPRPRARRCRWSTSGTCARAECKCDRAGPPARVGRDPGVRRRRSDRHVPRPDHRRGRPCRARSWWCSTTSPTAPSCRCGSTPRPTRVWCPSTTPTDAVPARAIRYGIDNVHGAGRRRDHGRRKRRRRADRRTVQARRTRRGGGGGVALHERRTADRRPDAQEPALAPRRPLAVLVRPRRYPGRDQLVQGVRGRLRARRAHRLRHRVRDRDRAGGEGAATTPAGRRGADHLARTRAGRVKLQEWRGGYPGTSSGTGSPSDPSCRSTPCAQQERNRDHERARDDRRPEGAGQRLLRVHRRVPGRGSARPRLHGRGDRQPLEVRAGSRSPTTTIRTTRSSKATAATSTS